MTPPIHLDSGAATPITPAASESEAQLLAWSRDYRSTIPSPPMTGKKGRKQYRIKDPRTDKNKTWTRVTTYAGAISDKGGLTTWRERILAKGLYANDRPTGDLDDKTVLDAAISRALHRGGIGVPSDIGTAIHRLCELTPAEAAVVDLPRHWLDIRTAYWGMLDTHNLTVEHTERTVLIPEINCAGTIDALVRCPDGQLRVLDIKTGSVTHSGVQYAVQLAIYAHATHYWTPDGLQDMPDVDQTVAYIAHLPRDGEHATLLTVDISVGWELAKLCGLVRGARTTKNLIRPVDTVTPDATTGDTATAEAEDTDSPEILVGDRTKWIQGRLNKLRSNPDAMQAVATHWPTGVTHSPPWAHADLDRIDHLLADVECAIDAPFGPSDPSLVDISVAARLARDGKNTEPPPSLPEVTDDTPPGDPTVIPALMGTIAALDQRCKDRAATWSADAKRHARPWGSAKHPTERFIALHCAVLACLDHLWDYDCPDTLTRAALELTLGEPLMPSWATGAVIGSLTITQALRLEQIAAGFTGDAEIAAELAAILPWIA